MNAINVIALIFAVLVVIKILFVSINRRFWFENVTKKVYSFKGMGWIFAILSVVIFYYLIQSLSIVQIFAVMCFGSLLTAIAFLSYGKDLMDAAKVTVAKGLSEWQWMITLVWLALSIIVLYEVLF